MGGVASFGSTIKEVIPTRTPGPMLLVELTEPMQRAKSKPACRRVILGQCQCVIDEQDGPWSALN